MMRNRGAQMQRILFLGVILVMGLSGATYAQESIDEPHLKNPNRPYHLLPHVEPKDWAGQGEGDPEEVEISTGFVFLNGQYVCPPYTIASSGTKVSLNGIMLPALSIARPNQRTPFQRRGGRRPSQRLMGSLKQLLTNDGLLIHLHEDTMAMIPFHQALPILDTLLSSQSPEEKIKGVIPEELTGVSSAQWTFLVDGFEASPEILDRVAILRETRAEQQELGGKIPWYLAGSFPIMPILGFLLAVLALGTLLSCRPPTTLPRLRQRHQKMYCQQVLYLVGLFVVLNLYDLTCTLLAKGGVGFWEMNPFAGSMLNVPPRVICFKLCLTICPAILLIVARHRRLAQMASWWGGVLYTVLILRWVTYSAMFMH